MSLLNPNFTQNVKKSNDPIRRKQCYRRMSGQSYYSLLVNKISLAEIETSYLKASSITKTFYKFLLLSNSL